LDHEFSHLFGLIDSLVIAEIMPHWTMNFNVYCTCVKPRSH